MANVALIFSGQYVKYVSGLRAGLPAGTCLHCKILHATLYWYMRSCCSVVFCGRGVSKFDSILIILVSGTDLWGHSLKLLMTAVVAGGAVVMAFMAYMQGQVNNI